MKDPIEYKRTMYHIAVPTVPYQDNKGRVPHLLMFVLSGLACVNSSTEGD